MSDWWHQAPRGQWVILLGIVVMLFVLYLQNFVWGPLEESIVGTQTEVTILTNKVHSQEHKLKELKNIEARVSTERQRLVSNPQLTWGEYQVKTFRQEVAEVAMQTQVVLHVWKEKEQNVVANPTGTNIPIDVRVEGNFHETRNFLEKLASLPWVKRIDSVVINPKSEKRNSGIISVDVFLHGLSSEVIQDVQRFLAT